MLELEAWAEGEDVSFDHKLSDVSQIERTNEELDVEFLRNVSRESDAAIGEWIAKLQQAPDAHERITKIFLQSISADASDDTLRSLYRTGAVDLSVKDDVNDRTILHEAAIVDRSIILELLFSQPDKIAVDASAVDIYGRTPLHYACSHGREQMIKPFLSAGAPVDALDQDNFTALLFAISQNHKDCVARLLECGARVDPASEQDYIPLSVACQRGLYAISEMLLQHHASIVADAEGLYPQHLIAQAGHYKLIPLLKEYGADINTVDKLNDWIALFYAAGEGHVETVRALIDAGADLTFYDKKNLSPVYYAAWEGHLDCMELLINAQKAQGISQSPLNVSHMQDATIATTAHLDAIAETPMDMDIDMDISDVDAIPDLSLPPPILPLRRYGHNFLDKKTFIEIVFDVPNGLKSSSSETTTSQTHRVSKTEYTSSHNITPIIQQNSTAPPPVRFYSNIPASKLTVSSKLLDVIPRSLLLPLADDSRTLSFQVENLDEFTIDFEIFPTFGSRIIAKTTALSHLFNIPSGTGSCTLPLFDLRLQVVGDISFKFSVIKPYQGTPLEITNYDVYWKSTSQIDSPSAPSSLASIIGSSTGAVASGLLSSSHASSLSMASNGPISSSSGFNAHHLQHAQVHSFVTASSLSGCYARVFVQLTKDRIPVIYPFWTVDVEQYTIPLCQLTFEQFEALGLRDPQTLKNRASIGSIHKPAEACELLYLSYLSLADTLAMLPLNVNLDLSILYPTEVEKDYLNVTSAMLDLNCQVNSILNIVFDHAREARRHTAPEAAAAAAAGLSSSNILRNRSLVFSSYHPNVCTVLNWKQPNYPVLFCVDVSATENLTKCVSAHGLPVREPEDRRCGSMREATTFASSNNLLGLICDSRLLVSL